MAGCGWQTAFDPGRCLRTLQGHKIWLWSVAISPDSQTLVSGSEDETLNLWDRDIKTLRAARPYEGMNLTGTTGLTEATIATLRALGGIVLRKR